MPDTRGIFGKTSWVIPTQAEIIARFSGKPAGKKVEINSYNSAKTYEGFEAFAKLKKDINDKDIKPEKGTKDKVSFSFETKEGLKVTWINLEKEKNLELHPEAKTQLEKDFYGADIVFDYGRADSFNFSFESPSLPRVNTNIDFVEILIHELGHTHGLDDNSTNNGHMMYYTYVGKYFPMRELQGADSAGAIHQHPVQDYSGALGHSLVLPS